MTAPPHEARVAVVEALIALSSIDLPYGDLYLQHAQDAFEQVLGQEQYHALCHERDGLTRLAKDLREVAERGDWSQARALAQHGVRSRQRISDHQRLLALGDALDAPRLFHANPTALALGGIVVEPMPHLGRVHETCIAQLRFLLINDAARAEFYRTRLAWFEDLHVHTDSEAQPAADPSDLHRRMIEAAEQSDFALAERLSTAIMGAAENTVRGRAGAAPAVARPLPTLAAPFPDMVVQRAQHLGLSAVTLAADVAVDAYLRSCDERIVLPAAIRTDPVAASAASSYAGDEPHGVSDGLRAVLDPLLLHPFVTSAGSRYLPWFEAETMLVETFPESEPEIRTGLLSALNLRGRRGLSRLVIEHAVRSRGPQVCVDLGLDPALYVVIPIPFDAYLRLAPRFSWGGERMWTHFDGYQATRELTLRALVGGDAVYGGAEDLCSVARDYASERILARFCIVRRQRLAMRGR